MAEIVANISFSGVNGEGIIAISPAGIIRAGDKVAGVSEITSGTVPSGSAAHLFAPVIPADDRLIQISNTNLSTGRFLATIVRD